MNAHAKMKSTIFGIKARLVGSHQWKKSLGGVGRGKCRRTSIRRQWKQRIKFCFGDFRGLELQENNRGIFLGIRDVRHRCCERDGSQNRYLAAKFRRLWRR